MDDRCDDLEPRWSAWLDGVLHGDDRVRAEAHLRHCRACSDEVEGLRRVRELVGNLPVRRLPPGVGAPPAAVPAPDTGRSSWSGGQRVAGGVAMAVGLVGGAVFGLGGQAPPDERVVSVPVDLYVADHLVHTVGGPLSTPVVVDGGP